MLLWCIPVFPGYQPAWSESPCIFNLDSIDKLLILYNSYIHVQLLTATLHSKPAILSIVCPISPSLANKAKVFVIHCQLFSSICGAFVHLANIYTCRLATTAKKQCYNNYGTPVHTAPKHIAWTGTVLPILKQAIYMYIHFRLLVTCYNLLQIFSHLTDSQVTRKLV